MAKILKAAIKVYSVLLTLAKIVVIAIILLAAYSFAVEDVKIVNVEKPFVTHEGSKIIINIPVTIKNYGFYNISDLRINYEINNKTSQFINGSSLIGSIPTDSIDTFDVPIAIDFEKIYKEEYPSLYHFYNKDTLYVNFSVSLKYMFGLVDISIDMNHTFDWIPPIESTHVYPSEDVHMNSSLYFYIPYEIKTANYLSGSAEILGEIKGDGEKYGNFNTSLTLGTYYKGKIMVHINSEAARYLITHSMPLKMVGNITLLGFNIPFKRTYYWGAPLDNLTYRVFNNGSFYYSFTDSAPYPLSMNVTKIYYYQGSEVGRDSSMYNVNPGEHVEKYERLNITRPIDKIEIIFYEGNTGFSYEEVINL